MDEGKKNFLKIGLLEIGIVLVIILILIGTLNYFNALPFANFLPFLPQQNINPQNVQTGVITPSPDPNKPITVSVVSENTSYSISLQNEKKLIEYLNKWGLYNKRLYTKLEDINNAKTISKITIILTDKEQDRKLLSNASDQKPYLTYTTAQSGDNFIIYVWVADSVLSQTTSPEEKGDFVTYAVFSVLYNMATSQMSKTPEERTEDFNTELAEFGKTKLFILNPK